MIHIISKQIDTKKPFGPSGKTPWITLNGTNLTDSQLIIEYLSKYDKARIKYFSKLFAILKKICIENSDKTHGVLQMKKKKHSPELSELCLKNTSFGTEYIY